MLVVGYPQKQFGNYDLTFHSGAGRIRETVEEAFSTETNLMVQADGHELQAIQQQFSDISMASARVVRWTNETARFIINNITL